MRWGWIAVALWLAPIAQAETPTAKVVLEDAGQGKAAPLRYALKKGTSQTFRIEVRVKNITEAGPLLPPQTVNAPVMVMDFRYDVTSVEAGRFGIAAEVTGMTVAETDGLPEALRQPILDALKPMEGATATGTMTDRGGIEGLVWTARDGADNSVVEDMNKTLNNVGFVLPAEPVGEGARWTQVLDVDTAGLSIQQTVKTTLTARNGDLVSLDQAFVQTAEAQAVSGAALPPGTTASLQSLTGQGDGEVTLDLGLPIARMLTSTVQTIADIGVQVPALGGSMGMKVTTDVTITIATK